MYFRNVHIYYDDTTPPLEVHAAINVLRRNGIGFTPHHFTGVGSSIQAATAVNAGFGHLMMEQGIPRFANSLTSVVVTYQTSFDTPEQVAVGPTSIANAFNT